MALNMDSSKVYQLIHKLQKKYGLSSKSPGHLAVSTEPMSKKELSDSKCHEAKAEQIISPASTGIKESALCCSQKVRFFISVDKIMMWKEHLT